jgi:ATP-dependent Clp protease ATP-binding subunit ClpA
MLGSITKKFNDMRIISALCTSAEKHALAEGQKLPGAEHFMLAAFELPDGSAKRILARLGKNPGQLQQAVQQQYADALQSIGVETQADLQNSSAHLAPNIGIFKAQPSGQALMQALATTKKEEGNTPLLSCHVLLVIAQMQNGVAARALRKLGIDLAQLQQETRKEIQLFLSSSSAV